jgi:hypothetical protein
LLHKVAVAGRTAEDLEETWIEWHGDKLSAVGQQRSTKLPSAVRVQFAGAHFIEEAVGHMIAFQLEHEIEKTGKLGEIVERMATQGRLTPDLWMQQTTGRPIGPEALLEATAKALQAVHSAVVTQTMPFGPSGARELEKHPLEGHEGPVE